MEEERTYTDMLKNRYRGSEARKMVAMVVVSATVYMIWRNINSTYWDQVIMHDCR